MTVVLEGAALVTLGGLGALGLRVHLAGRASPVQGAAPRVAVVLGARVFPDGTPSAALIERVRVGVTLLESGQATELVLSGGTPDSRPTEASVMARLARDLGAPGSGLVLEAASRSTFENARECAALLGHRGVREVWLVTCDFHVARARAYFRRAGLAVHAVPSCRSLSAAERATATTKEIFALLRRPGLLAHLG